MQEKNNLIKNVFFYLTYFFFIIETRTQQYGNPAFVKENWYVFYVLKEYGARLPSSATWMHNLSI
jgi:hypothetical protein